MVPAFVWSCRAQTQTLTLFEIFMCYDLDGAASVLSDSTCWAVIGFVQNAWAPACSQPRELAPAQQAAVAVGERAQPHLFEGVSVFLTRIISRHDDQSRRRLRGVLRIGTLMCEA